MNMLPNVIIILLLALAFIYILNRYNHQVEGYSNELFDKIRLGEDHSSWNQLETGKRSVDCYSLKPGKCMDNTNCGLCLMKGEKLPQCVPGDVQGPYFKDNCDGWAYTDYYDRHIFGEKVTTITPPWSIFYPDYEAWYPMTGRAPLIY